MDKIRTAFVSVVPSPYQRDLFAALHRRPEVDLDVFYLEAGAPDSPWPEKALASYERVLAGRWLPVGSARCHVNWPLPDLRSYGVVVVNTLMSFTAQWLLRSRLRSRPWIFWGERLGRGGRMHQALSAPLHRARGIAGIGTMASSDYRARYPKPAHWNIPYHCELGNFLALERSAERRGVTFLFCGQMIARKGVDTLIAAFAQLPSEARLLLVGREADLPTMLAGVPYHVRERIEYAGFQAPEALPAFYARADVFVLPSRYDGWGVVVNQAIAAGMPVICSDKVGAGFDLVESGVNGFIFAAGDTGGLARQMQHLLAAPELVAKLGAVSREKSLDYLPERGAEKWVTAICAAHATA